MINRQSVECHRVELSPEDARDWPDHPFSGIAGKSLTKAGDLFWLRDAAGMVTDLVIWIPGNEGGSIAPIPVMRPPVPPGMIAWEWDGNEDSPTLKPSIWRNKPGKDQETRNEWHGHLEHGRLRSD